MSTSKSSCSGVRRSLMHSALFAVFSLAVFAPVTGMAQTANDPGHLHNSQGIVWKNSTGLCWRTGSWTPANATAECNPDLMTKAEAPAEQRAEAPPPAAAPTPAPALAPAKFQTRKMTFSAEELFDFDKAVLKPEGKAGLDKLTTEINGMNYESVLVNGHTDRLGKTQYNQKLSERRADAVKSYLLGKGIPDNRITSAGMGESRPVTRIDDCKGPVSKKLIACLQPDRRVEVDVAGSREVAVSQ